MQQVPIPAVSQHRTSIAGHGVRNRHCSLGRVFGIGYPSGQHDATRGGQPRPMRPLGYAHQRYCRPPTLRFRSRPFAIAISEGFAHARGNIRD
eukprot:scaffold148_cov341-Pavlova_lutheri.AAC.4